MNAKQVKKLRKLASTLPSCMTMKRMPVKGSVLIENKVTLNESGDQISADEYYISDWPVPVDHYKKIIINYRRGGIEAVEEYCDYIYDHDQKTSNKSVAVSSKEFNIDCLLQVNDRDIHYAIDSIDEYNASDIKAIEKHVNIFLEEPGDKSKFIYDDRIVKPSGEAFLLFKKQ